MPSLQCVLRVLRAVPDHCLRHDPQPVRVTVSHLCGDHRSSGLRAVVGRPGVPHHRHDPGQHVWGHVAVGDQPERRLPG